MLHHNRAAIASLNVPVAYQQIRNEQRLAFFSFVRCSTITFWFFAYDVHNALL